MGHRATLIEAVPQQGSVNWTFCATDGASRYSIRLNRTRSVADAFKEYERERWCIEMARTCGVLTPRVMRVGHGDESAWMIQEWIDGVQATETAKSFRTLGAYARQLSEARVSPDVALFPDSQKHWTAQVTYNLEQLRDDDPLISLGVYRTIDQTFLHGVFAELLTRDCVVALDHGDLSPRNVLVRGDGAFVLIDWGCATFEVSPWVALSRMRAQHVLHGTPPVECGEAFADGMGLSRAHAVAMQPTVHAWALLKAIDLVRWAIDRCPERILETADAARRVMDAVRP